MRWPLVLRLLAWRLQGSGTDAAFPLAVAAGLNAMAWLQLAVSLAIWTSRQHGLGVAHFQWPLDVARVVRRHVTLLAFVAMPCVFVLVALRFHGDQDWSHALGRMAFMVAYVMLAVTAWRVLRPAGLVATTIDRRGGPGLARRLRLICYPVLVLAPLGLVFAAALGHYSAATTLQQQLQQSLWLAAVVLLIHALALRWLYVARRRLAIEQARRRRDVAREKLAEALESGAGEPAPPAAEHPGDATLAAMDEVDIGAINEQTRRILRLGVLLALLVGGWMIWVDVAPALRVLDAVELWTQTAHEEVPRFDRDGVALLSEHGAALTETVTKRVPVTLANLLVALVMVFVVVASARNIPGLLEITLLQRLPLEPAGRYAITALTRYVVVILGVVVVSGALGVAWSHVQWLVAAVTVGLGFGLQEIFANFVSGVILLLERPIRDGDTVTVGSVIGTVTRIRMRATTIEDWDRKELVVPNKEFITGQLVNWTLSDSTLRLIVRVGIAYGSDVALATRLLYRVASEAPEVKDDPPARAVFTEFGDSALNFELRVFVDSPDLVRRLPHDLNCAIDRIFREHGIEIAFPQRDLHLRSLPEALTHAIAGRSGTSDGGG
jgi:potassium efflux system protein